MSDERVTRRCQWCRDIISPAYGQNECDCDATIRIAELEQQVADKESDCVRLVSEKTDMVLHIADLKRQLAECHTNNALYWRERARKAESEIPTYKARITQLERERNLFKCLAQKLKSAIPTDPPTPT